VDPLQAGDPRQVGAYRLVGRLGEGGMGQVFLGVSPGGRPVAVKIVRPDFTNDAEYRQRFAREVEAARRVGGFHTAPVVDADPSASPPWMATGYIAGPSLQAVIRERGLLTVQAATALGAALAEGLGAIHACGLVHRDLKPGNIIMADDGPRIIDFGIAHPASATDLTTPGTLMGTYPFMSPEQMRGERVTPASDVFALGGVLAYAVTGRAPFDSPTVAGIMYRVLNSQPDLAGIAPGPFRAWVEKCLSKEPESRPRPADLIAGLTGGPVPAIGGPAPPAAPPVRADEIAAERHENITITQHANVSPGSVVIQVAGNAKVGDDTLQTN
jgi:serine/threonine protein kinase